MPAAFAQSATQRFRPSAADLLVAGKPYSAEESIDHTQTLIDGTHLIQHIGSVKYYRDSQGRVRTERWVGMEPNSFLTTTIDDPTTGEDYYLDVRRRTAMKGVFPGNGIHQIPGVDCPADLSVYSSRELNQKTTCETLGTKEIDGMPAAGILITTITPTGAIGNDRPIAHTTEKWTSPELKIVLSQKETSPQLGETVTRITKISRDEPDPALLRIPADYKINTSPSITAQ